MIVIFVVWIILELCRIDSTAQMELLFSSLTLPLASQIKPSCNFYLHQCPSEQSCGYRSKIPAMGRSCWGTRRLCVPLVNIKYRLLFLIASYELLGFRFFAFVLFSDSGFLPPLAHSVNTSTVQRSAANCCRNAKVIDGYQMSLMCSWFFWSFFFCSCWLLRPAPASAGHMILFWNPADSCSIDSDGFQMIFTHTHTHNI